MSRFLPLDASTLLRNNGIFSEHQVYCNNDGELFARRGNGYLRLMDHSATSASRVFWSDLKLGTMAYTVSIGKLVLTQTTKVVPMSDRNRRTA